MVPNEDRKNRPDNFLMKKTPIIEIFQLLKNESTKAWETLFFPLVDNWLSLSLFLACDSLSCRFISVLGFVDILNLTFLLPVSLS